MKKIGLVICFLTQQLIVFAQTPINDSCEAAISITFGDTIFGSTIGATEDSFTGFNYPCQSGNGKGVWYKLSTQEMEAIYSFSLCSDPQFDTYLSLVSMNACDSVTCITWDDDGCSGSTASLVSQILPPNEEFYLWVGGYSASASGDFTLVANSEICDTSLTLISQPQLIPNNTVGAPEVEYEVQAEADFGITYTWEIYCPSGWWGPGWGGIPAGPNFEVNGPVLGIHDVFVWIDSCLVRCAISNNCGQRIVSDTVILTHVPDSLSSIGSNEDLSQFKVFQNQLKLRIITTNPDIRYTAFIYDLSGRRLLSNKSNQSRELLIDISGIPAGFYLVNILTENQSQHTEKVFLLRDW